jgi:hypothetical protein
MYWHPPAISTRTPSLDLPFSCGAAADNPTKIIAVMRFRRSLSAIDAGWCELQTATKLAMALLVAR